jgi:hypothetical protein
MCSSYVHPLNNVFHKVMIITEIIYVCEAKKIEFEFHFPRIIAV